jgi:hypothetical protein
MATKQVNQPLVNLTITQDVVFLTITIGNFQIGGSTVQIEGSATPVAKGNISHLLLGKKADLQGKKISVITTVLDSNPSTNNVVITTGFSGISTSPIINTGTVDNQGDLYVQNAEFAFN